MSYVVDNSISIFFITETWLTDLNNSTTATIKSYGFKIIHKFRSANNHHSKETGGGVAIVYKHSLNLTQVHLKQANMNTFEAVSAKFKAEDGDNVLCGCIYRTGPLAKSFFDELDEYIGSMFLKYTKILICGDINIHLDDSKSSSSASFIQIISSYGLHQLVTGPTHIHGHTIDVIITSHKLVTENNIKALNDVGSLFDNFIPDHYPLKFTIKDELVSATTDTPKTINFRNIKKIDNDQFHDELYNSLSTLSPPSNANLSFSDTIAIYNTQCTGILDNHAPVLVKRIKDRSSAPWFDGEYKTLRTKRRKAEAKWKKSNLPTDKTEYHSLRNMCNSLALEKKKTFYRNQFIKHNNSPKSLYNFVNQFMDKDKSLALPPNDSLQEVVTEFNNFFQSKIEKIRKTFKQSTNNVNNSTDNPFLGTNLSEFEPTNIDELTIILKESVLKSSTVDPLPAKLLNDNMDVLLPHLCDIVNLSLSTGNIDGVKLAHITPLIKGSDLDHSVYKNYRPISNLSFVGKLIERVVLRRLNAHLDKNNLHIPNQSGYKKSHSTETLLITIVNDLLIATKQNTATVVMMLDLSAAFDTVDHDLLLRILSKELGITGVALRWFKSFISGRCQKVKIGESESTEIIIQFGVPQGSVLGPVLFNLYIRSIYRTVQGLNFFIHGYADDHQVYKNYDKTTEYSMLVNEVPECFKNISKWMTRNYLQLNPGKTEIIVFGSPSVLASLSIRGVFLDEGVCIRFSPVVKNLGFRLDSCLTFNDQVKKLKQSCFHKLRHIAKMKYFLTETQIRILIQAVILSKIDYCNSLYYGCQTYVINQLQVIQNRACRIIFGMKKRENVDHRLQELHWLKVKERIEFKVLLLIFKSVKGQAPDYLNELITFNNDSGCRRRSLHIVNPRMQCRAFQSAAPVLWNLLPHSIRDSDTVTIFKSRLKTHLFKRSFNIAEQ